MFFTKKVKKFPLKFFHELKVLSKTEILFVGSIPSLKKNANEPAANNIAVVVKTILENALNCFADFLLVNISIMTRKEIPPVTIKTIM